MGKITKVDGTGIVIRGHDIDTDQIIPARFMTAITFEGIEKYAFNDVRYNEDGSLKAHPFNDEKFKNARVLIVNSNFGCGSSREHAPQTIMRHGIQAILGESFAEIFVGNCTTLGVPVLNLTPKDIAEIQDTVESNPQSKIAIDIENAKITVNDKSYETQIPSQIKKTLVQGTWDTTNVLLENTKLIEKVYETLPYIKNYS